MPIVVHRFNAFFIVFENEVNHYWGIYVHIYLENITIVWEYLLILLLKKYSLKCYGISEHIDNPLQGVVATVWI